MYKNNFKKKHFKVIYENHDFTTHYINPNNPNLEHEPRLGITIWILNTNQCIAMNWYKLVDILWANFFFWKIILNNFVCLYSFITFFWEGVTSSSYLFVSMYLCINNKIMRNIICRHQNEMHQLMHAINYFFKYFFL